MTAEMNTIALVPQSRVLMPGTCSLLWLLVQLLWVSSLEMEGTIHLPTGIAMKPCNNLIVKSIPGNFSTVLEIGRRYVSILLNDTGQLEPFKGAWKWEPDRVLHEPLRVFNDADKPIYECSTMKIFGDEVHNYDEAKRFCFFGDFSLVGSNNPAGALVLYAWSSTIIAIASFLHLDLIFECDGVANFPLTCIQLFLCFLHNLLPSISYLDIYANKIPDIESLKDYMVSIF